MAESGASRSRSSFFKAAVFLCFFNIWNSSNCNAEVVIQDVLWTREYDGGIDEKYFGTYRFVQSLCGTNNDGVCVQKGRCSEMGGIETGSCQEGFGECCMFVEKCSLDRTRIDVDQLVTVLETPSPSTTECTFRFRREQNICQIRLDFEAYETVSADPDGMCLTDLLRITNSITVERDFTTCGNLNGQHMYLSYGSEDTIEVAPSLQMTNSRYKIIATRISCNSINKAPEYCLQYFTKTSDVVRSFDFGGQQQNNQRYTICVNPMGASSYVTWKPCTAGVGEKFNIITHVQETLDICNTDWIQVKGQINVCEPFPEIRSEWKSYEVFVNFDGTEYPPAPPSFTIPVDPANCEAECISEPNAYTCACIPNPDVANQVCQCVIDTPLVPVQVDFNNTGFCLEYIQ